MNEANVITQWLNPNTKSLTSHGYVTNKRWLYCEQERLGKRRKCVIQRKIFKNGADNKVLRMRLVYK